jgi:hypothetical protein
VALAVAALGRTLLKMLEPREHAAIRRVEFLLREDKAVRAERGGAGRRRVRRR